MNNQRKQFLPARKGWLIISIITVIPILIAGCYYDKAEQLYGSSEIDCSIVPATYTRVQAIMASKCNTCHSARNAAGGTILETYEQVKAKADRINQRAIIDKTMPPTAPLSSEEIAILQCWISSGTPNN